ncbi:MAG: hypothetical protein ABIS21_05025, partial [Acidimicrobiales bacterium]
SDLYEATRGHPTLVAECIDARAANAWEDVAMRLGPWVHERAQTAGLWAQQILVTAALMEGAFEPEDLSLVLDLEASEVAEHLEMLCRKGLLRAGDRGYDLDCPLLRDVLVGGLSPSRRRVLRQRVLSGGVVGTPPSLELVLPKVDRRS